MFGHRSRFEARRQHSARDAQITALYRGTCDVQLPTGRTLKRVHFAIGSTWPVGTWVKIERVEQDWQVIGIGSSFTEVYVSPTPPIPPRVIGEWMQVEGWSRLGRPGAVAVSLPSGVSSVFSMGLDTLDTAGMQRCLGAVALDDLYVVAWLRPNSGQTLHESIRLQARRLVDDSLAWDSTVSLISSALLSDRSALSHLFWDPDARTLSIVGPNEIQTTLIEEDTVPGGFALTSLGGAAAWTAIAYEYLLRFTSSSFATYKRNESNQYVNLATLAIADLFTEAEFGLPTPTGDQLDKIRPWPFSAEDSLFRAVVTGRDSQDAWGHEIILAGETLGSQRAFTVNEEDNMLVLESALEAGDDYFRYDADRPSSTEPGSTPPYEYPYWVESGDNHFFGYHQWGGRKDFGDFNNARTLYAGYIPYGWFADGYAVGGTPTIYQYSRGIINYSFLCPRKVSNTRRDATWQQAKWIESPDLANSQSGAVLNSRNEIIYCSIDPVRAVVPGVVANLAEAVGDIPYTVPPHGEYTLPDGNTTNNGSDYPLELSYLQSTITHYHWPKSDTIHRTRLHLADSAGSLVTSLTLSNSFTGLSYTEASMLSRFPVSLEEAVHVPENVWEINLGPAPDTLDQDTWDDLILILQDWRTDVLDGPRPVLTVVNSTATEILARTEPLAPTDVLDGGGEEEQTETFTCEEFQQDFTLLEIPVSITSVIYNGEELLGGYSVTGSEFHLGFPAEDGIELEITYTYELPIDPEDVGRYVWTVTDARMACDFANGTDRQWAIVGVWSENDDSDQRKELHVIDLTDPSNPVIDASLEGSNLPDPKDFDRIVFAGGRILFPSSSGGSGWDWRTLA